MKTLVYSAILSISLLVKIGYAHAAPACYGKETVHRVENIVRIFMERPWIYTFMVRESENTFVVQQMFGSVKFVADVPPDRPMFAIQRLCEPTFSPNRNDLEIHIHSVASVEGGGWSAPSGKSTVQGNTQVIR